MTATDPKSPADQCRRNQRDIFPASRVMFCGRCGHATGGGYGHETAWCEVTQQIGKSHLCCPGSCELVDGLEIDQAAPCHPDEANYQQWAQEADAGRWRQ